KAPNRALQSEEYELHGKRECPIDTANHLGFPTIPVVLQNTTPVRRAHEFFKPAPVRHAHEFFAVLPNAKRREPREMSQSGLASIIDQCGHADHRLRLEPINSRSS